MTFSIILPPIGVLEMGRKSESDLGGLILGMGIISAFLKASGKVLVLRAQFKMSQKGVVNSTVNSCRIFWGKSPGPRDFFTYLFNNL